MNIFISSTYEDLINERNKTIETIDRFWSAIAMEKFCASNYQSKDLCLKKLSECDAYVLIFGFRYGSIDKEEGISLTQIEYRTALSLNLPIFVFIKENQNNIWASQENDPVRLKKHLDFKSLIEDEKYRKTFNSPDKLAFEIFGSIYEYQKENGELGIHSPAFEKFEKYFQPFSSKNNIFNHSYPLINNNLIDSINNFIVGTRNIGLFWGRGGIGKSKILYELGKDFNKSHQDYKLLFLKDEISLSFENISQIPSKRCVIIVDDAHRRRDLKVLLRVCLENLDKIKLVLSSRPQGIDNIRSSITSVGLDPQLIEEFGEIKGLDREGLTKLAESVLGQNYIDMVEPLVNIAQDSPLIVVVGGQLMLRNAIDINQLSQQKDFQRIILDKFQDELIGEATASSIPKEICKELLSLIAILAPLRLDSKILQEQIFSFLSIDEYKLIKYINNLEQLGILLHRGNSIRITPDILSDHILNKACFTNDYQNTGYQKKIYDYFKNISPKNILVNLSELDWQINRIGIKTDLLDEIWSDLKNDFYSGSLENKYLIIDWLENIAYYQPEKSWELINYIIKNKTCADVKINNSIYSYSYKDILKALPKVLRVLCFNLNYIDRCTKLLWELGCDDDRRTNSNPEHPIRILSEIASYDVGKPLKVNLLVLKTLKNLLKDKDIFNHLHSPLDILDEFLKKEGATQKHSPGKLIFDPFSVNVQTTKIIRDEVIVILQELTKSDSIKLTYRVIDSLIDALRDPFGLFNRKISKKEKIKWLEEELAILKVLENIIITKEDPIIIVKIIYDLYWFKKQSEKKRIKQEIKKIYKQINQDYEINLIKSIWYKFERDWDEDYHGFSEYVANQIKDTAEEFIKRSSNALSAFTVLNDLLNKFHFNNIDINPQFFLQKVADLDLKIAEDLCILTLENLQSPLVIYFSSFLIPLRKTKKQSTIELIKSAIKIKDDKIVYSISSIYHWNLFGILDDDDLEIVKILLGYEDISVKINTISSLKHFKDLDLKKVIAILIEFDIGQDSKLANEFYDNFDEKFGIHPDNLTDEQLFILVDKLVNIKDIDDYDIDKFLGFATSKNPQIATKMILERLNKNSNDEYNPVPYRGFQHAFKGISSYKNFKEIILEALDYFYKYDKYGFWPPLIFKIISDNFSSKSLEVIRDWIENILDSEKLEMIAHLFSEADPSFVFEQNEFVDYLLNASFKIDENCYRMVSSSLYCSAVGGLRAGTRGAPFPEDIDLKNKTTNILNTLTLDSHTFIFYKSILDKAESNIKNISIYDEED